MKAYVMVFGIVLAFAGMSTNSLFRFGIGVGLIIIGFIMEGDL